MLLVHTGFVWELKTVLPKKKNQIPYAYITIQVLCICALIIFSPCNFRPGNFYSYGVEHNEPLDPNTVIDRVIINVINEEVVDCNIPKLQIRNGTK